MQHPAPRAVGWLVPVRPDVGGAPLAVPAVAEAHSGVVGVLARPLAPDHAGPGGAQHRPEVGAPGAEDVVAGEGLSGDAEDRPGPASARGTPGTARRAGHRSRWPLRPAPGGAARRAGGARGGGRPAPLAGGRTAPRGWRRGRWRPGHAGGRRRPRPAPPPARRRGRGSARGRRPGRGPAPAERRALGRRPGRSAAARLHHRGMMPRGARVDLHFVSTRRSYPTPAPPGAVPPGATLRATPAGSAPGGRRAVAGAAPRAGPSDRGRNV